MSNVYLQEPPTSGKVILKTNYGDIEIELWAAETPRACRNFIQLCLEGYYDNTLFHRIIKNFMVQGGDPTGTGKGGKSIYGAPFMDEFHSRLKFSHRGIVAMANESVPNTNESQFFMTVDACPWLDRKHTIFGKVEGNTIFNLLKISELETDKKNGDRPISDPIPHIKRVEVTLNPFDDIIARNLTNKDKYNKDEKGKVPAVVESQQQTQQQSKLKKQYEFAKPSQVNVIKNKNLLSFDDEGEQENEDQNQTDQSSQSSIRFKKIKIKSSHDALQNDPQLSKQQAISQEQLDQAKMRKEQLEKAKEQLVNNVKKVDSQQSNQNNNQQSIQATSNSTQIKATPESIAKDLQQQMKQSVIGSAFNSSKRDKIDIEKEIRRMERRDRSRSRSKSADMSPVKRAIKRADKKRGVRKFATKYSSSDDDQKKEGQSSSSEESDFSDGKSKNKPTNSATQRQALEKTRDEYNKMKADLLQFKQNKVGSLLDDENLDVQVKVSALDLQRQKFIKQMKMTKHRENETLAKLNDFSSKIKSKTVKTDEQNWMNNKLKFHIDSQRAYDVDKAIAYQEKQGTSANFENFVTGGDPNKKYAMAYAQVKRPDLGDDVIQGMNIEDFVSMQELMDLALKRKNQDDIGVKGDQQ